MDDRKDKSKMINRDSSHQKKYSSIEKSRSIVENGFDFSTVKHSSALKPEELNLPEITNLGGVGKSQIQSY